MNDNLSPSDIAAVVGNTDRNANPYYGAGFGDGAWIWFILILAFMSGGWGGFGGANNGAYEFPWLITGQQGINNNTNAGFDTLNLSNQVNGVRDGVYGISNQLCNSTASVVQALNTGFANAETSDNARQTANMQQAFNNQLSTLQGFNGVTSQLASCCCENRLATQDLKSTVLSENCSDREALSNGIRDIITNQNNAVQRVLDQLCQDKIDNKNEKISDLQREILMKDLQASQIAQTAQLRAGQVEEIDALYNRLSNSPVGTVPVYGSQPIFTASANGCGCGGYAYNGLA